MLKVSMALSKSLVWERVIGGHCREGEEGRRQKSVGPVKALSVYPKDFGKPLEILSKRR